MLVVKTRTFSHIVCIKMEVNSQRRKILLFLSTGMAAVTSTYTEVRMIIYLESEISLVKNIVRRSGHLNNDIDYSLQSPRRFLFIFVQLILKVTAF